MSALSFLSKKSWHTGLQQNQEAVWKAEKSALEERRKLDELRKERDREREIQELERLQEEAGGKKKRIEKVDWMYNAPSSGTNIDKNELEDYLLGKKRVDKLLKADEGLEHSRGNQQGPISEQRSIGSDRDLAAKIREDPMFAIKQQEQAAYQALLKDPARLRAMKKAAGLDQSETKEERRRRKEEKKWRRRDEEGVTTSSKRGRHDVEESRYKKQDYEREASRYDDRARRDSRYEDRRPPPRSPSRERAEDLYDRDRRREFRNQDRRPPPRSASRERAEDLYDRDRRRDGFREGKRDSYSDRKRDDSYRNEGQPYRSRRDEDYHHQDSSFRQQRTRSRSPQSTRPRQSEVDLEAERQAKLAAMQQNATNLTSSRTEYLAKIKQEDEDNAKREQELRLKLQKSKEKGYGDGKGSFLIKQQKDLNGMDLHERLKRSREGLQRFDGT